MLSTNSEVLSTIAASPVKVEVASEPTSTVPMPSQPGVVEEAAALSGHSSPASTPETLLMPITSDEESNSSDTQVIVTANLTPPSASQTTASHVVSPQEAAAIIVLVASPADDSQWVAGVKYTALPEGPLRALMSLQALKPKIAHKFILLSCYGNDSSHALLSIPSCYAS
ncbi:hypothetical protein ARMSODRAFT_1026028 [Armillaria solidipes]|uniref:Uncharacterized protein n=1 Tax=Armillaria solidipes TaxID=1076256 RepID=A0A2H3B4K9_9AGAR|nr:hypothetical protein ARMSODRAFT_1026028 [Armillaria solidipes]